jgi:hypothetical protein
MNTTRPAAAAATRPRTIEPADVMAEQPKHCDACGAVVIDLLVNRADASRQWVPAKWDGATRVWVPHTCETARATL